MGDASGDSPARSILVAAGDPLTRSLAREAIARERWRFEAVADVASVLDRFGQGASDLLLVDADLPAESGAEGAAEGRTGGGLACCAELRQRFPDAETPVVLMVEGRQRDAVDALLRHPHVDFVTRPIDWHLLGARLRALLERDSGEHALMRRAKALSRAERATGIGTWEWNPERRELRGSDQTRRLLGLEPTDAELDERSLLERLHVEDAATLREKAREALEVSKGLRVEVRLRPPVTPDRRLCFEGERCEGPEAGWIQGTLREAGTELRDREPPGDVVHYDELTGLANRRLFAGRLARSVAAARRKGHLLALLILDIDQFKRVNDSLGHEAGDRLLQHVAATLVEHVRGSDLVGRLDSVRSEAEVSRLVGDEFTILLSKIAEPDHAGDVARRILDALSESITMDGYQISSRASCGIAIFPGDGDGPEKLARNAQTALHHAKVRGRGGYQFYSDWMNQVTRRKLSLESRLRQALERERLGLHYQPRVDLRTRRVLGSEALLRWEDEELGRISPKEAIPLAEEMGLIVAIGDWVLERSCNQVREWQRAGLGALPVSVNVSTRQFGDNDLCGAVSRALRTSELDPSLLELEITEGLLLRDDEQTAIALRDLRAMGIKVALDDFGSGYSSLSYVTRFPLDILKLDRCFVRDVHNDPSAEGVATAVIAMAHSLRLRVVAEGIDEEEQARILLGKGCDEAQGFLFGGAIPADEFAAILRAQADDDGEQT